MSQQPADTSKTTDEQGETHPDNVFSAVDGLAQQLATIERFVSRRFDEISMEINATSQQVDMAEEGIVRRFAEIVEVLKAISFSGDGRTPANAGVELDAVVDMTEEAANRILDAATRTTELTEDENIDWSTEEARNHLKERIQAEMSEIFMACSFQDVTGQRIRKTLENLKHIEERLNGALEKMGIVVDVVDNPMDQGEVATSQGDIDDIFAEKRAVEGFGGSNENLDGDKEASQDDIDSMF